MLSASTLVWLLGISALQVVGGVAVGWWLRSTNKIANNTAEVLQRRLTEALSRVQRLAGTMSADASQHAEQVEAAGKRIHAASGNVEQLHHALLDGMSQILAANDRLQTQLTDVEAKLEEQSRQIETQLAEARIDSLTGVANRRSFDEELTRRLAEWRRRHSPMSLMLVDIDNFKQVNDRYGHQIGDAVLRETAKVLENTMREMDFTARFGGEEFAVIFPATTLAEARRAAQRALQGVAGHLFEKDGHELQLTISVGVAEVGPSDDAETLIRRADEALYLSKAAGRNCGHFSNGSDFLLLESPRLIECNTVAASSATVEREVSRAAASAAPRSTPAREDEAEADSLTGLPAAPAFSTELRRRVQRARAEDRLLTLILIDVDYLGRINHHEGRDGGDQVLKRLAEVLGEVARDCDFAARYHEGQFALTLEGVGLSEASRTAERIRRAMQAFPYRPGVEPIEATVSCGVAEAAPGDRSVSLVMRASRALAAAKSAGRDCIFLHDGRTVEPVDEAATN
jgi:diguanylate cyclase